MFTLSTNFSNFSFCHNGVFLQNKVVFTVFMFSLTNSLFRCLVLMTCGSANIHMKRGQQDKREHMSEMMKREEMRENLRTEDVR